MVALACPRRSETTFTDTVSEQQGGVGVAEVVQPDHRQQLLLTAAHAGVGEQPQGHGSVAVVLVGPPQEPGEFGHGPGVHLRRPRLRRTRRESCLARWLKIADREDGLASQTSPTVATGGGGDLEAENRELRRRTKQLEQET